MKRRSWALFAAGLLVVAACGTDAADGGGTVTTEAATSTTTAAEPATTTTAVEATSTTAAEETADGMTTSDVDLGTILVDPQGFTLYVFANDTGGESTCYDSCAGNWPAVPGDTPIGSGLEASLFGTTTRTDGTEQLTVNEQPLYRYASDANPGDINGQGVGGVWFVVGADGAMIGGPEATNDSTGDDIGYDY